MGQRHNYYFATSYHRHTLRNRSLRCRFFIQNHPHYFDRSPGTRRTQMITFFDSGLFVFVRILTRKLTCHVNSRLFWTFSSNFRVIPNNLSLFVLCFLYRSWPIVKDGAIPRNVSFVRKLYADPRWGPPLERKPITQVISGKCCTATAHKLLFSILIESSREFTASSTSSSCARAKAEPTASL